MGQTSPAQTALNQRMVELLTAAVEKAPSVTAVAAAAGIPRTTLQNIIGPTARPVTVDQATRLAIALGVDPIDWFTELRALAVELGAQPITTGAGPSSKVTRLPRRTPVRPSMSSFDEADEAARDEDRETPRMGDE